MERMDRALTDFYARLDLTEDQKAVFPVYTEIQDAADAMSGDLPLDQLGGACAMEIAKILTRFDGEIDDEWRHNLIIVGAGMLRLMKRGRG